jgi:predicted NBD/HSP70 family sugar kinase
MQQITKANQSSAAIHNRRLAIQLLRRYGRLSRRQLAQITGLRTSTLTYIVRDLMDQNIVRTVGKAESKTVGKKQILLEINPSLGWVVGVGLEMDRATLVFEDAAGEVIDSLCVEVGNDAESLPALLRATIDDRAAEHKLRSNRLMGLGVGLPGIVDSDRGRVLRSAWLSVEDLPLRAMIAEQFDVKLVIENDVNFAALAEAHLGGARGLDNFVYFLMNAEPEGPGYAIHAMGSSIFLDGRVYRGAHYAAGEVDTLVKGVDHEVISEHTLAQIAEPGTPLSDEMRSLARQVGRTLTPIVEMIDPEAVVLGGNVNIANKEMVAEIERLVADQLGKAPQRMVCVRPSPLGDRGVSTGAAIAAIDVALLGEDPMEETRDRESVIREVLGETACGV